MVKRTLKQQHTHTLVAAKGDTITSRCGLSARKPPVGFGDMVNHGTATCPNCIAKTEALKLPT